jgi:hypothetical protein
MHGGNAGARENAFKAALSREISFPICGLEKAGKTSDRHIPSLYRFRGCAKNPAAGTVSKNFRISKEGHADAATTRR